MTRALLNCRRLPLALLVAASFPALAQQLQENARVLPPPATGAVPVKVAPQPQAQPAASR